MRIFWVSVLLVCGAPLVRTTALAVVNLRTRVLTQSRKRRAVLRIEA